MREVGTVPTTGVGRDDYTSEVSLGQVRPGISLKYNQQLVMFGYIAQDFVPVPYPIKWIKGLAAPGASVHVVNIATGLSSPYTVPKGYIMSIIQVRCEQNQDWESQLFFDGLFVGYTLSNSGQAVDFADIVSYSTALLDPTASTSHTVDMQLYNRGLSNMRGAYTLYTILESIGTPPFPTEKDTQCPFCESINRVPVTATKIVCSKCGNTYYVFDTTSIRRL